MSTGEQDDEIYTDAPSNAPVADLRLKIAMFEKPITTSATKPKLAPQPSRSPNGVSPKPPAKLPPKKQGQDKAPIPPKNGKPASESGPLSPKNRTNVGTSAGKGGAPSAVRQSIFHQVDREQNAPATKPYQKSPPTLDTSGQKYTLYPPDKTKHDCKTPPKLPERRPEDKGLIMVDGRTYRKLPFVVPKGQAPAKPPKPPVASTKVENKRAEKEEIYEDASTYRDKFNDETLNAGENYEEDYEEVGAFSEAFRKQQQATSCDEELYDDTNVTT